MKALPLGVVLAYVVGAIFHAARDNVPAYDKWGASSSLCGTSGPAAGSSEFEDPTAAATSFLYFVAALDNPVALLYAGILSAASFLLHGHETDGSRELDFYVAALTPTVIALLEVPTLASAAVVLGLILQYETGLDHMVVAGVGIGIAAINCFRVGIDRHTLGAILVCVGAAIALRGGDRNTAICTNNKELSYAYDVRHASWHVVTAVLLYIGVGIFSRLQRPSMLPIALAASLPALLRFVDLDDTYFETWVAAAVLSSVAMLMVALWPNSYMTVSTSPLI